MSADNLEAVIAQLPALKRPTVNQLYGSDDYEITTVADKAGVNLLIPALKGAGMRTSSRYRSPRSSARRTRQPRRGTRAVSTITRIRPVTVRMPVSHSSGERLAMLARQW